MFRSILVFVILTIMIMFGIAIFRNLSGKELWSVVKLLTYSVVCATIAVVILLILVIVF